MRSPELARHAILLELLVILSISLAACGLPSRTKPAASLYPELILSKTERLREVTLKNARVLDLLRRENLSGVLVVSAADFAWATAGAAGWAPLFLMDDGRKFFFTRRGEASGALLEDLADMGYEAKTAAWLPGGVGQDWYAAVLRELSEGRPIGADVPLPEARDIRREIAALRVPLTEGEVREYRWLGRKTAEEAESICRQIEPGMTDRGIEAILSEALLRQAIRAAALRVIVDARVSGDAGRLRSDVSKLERQAAVSVCAERWGLRVEMTRIVRFGALTEGAGERLKAAARVNAGFWARTLPGANIGSILEGAAADYAETGHAEDWLSYDPGGAIGYESSDRTDLFGSAHEIRSPQAFAWKAAVGDERIQDTILLVGDRMEVLTETPDWPRVESRAQGRIYRSPGILIR